MKVIRTYTLLSGEKIENLTDEQKKSINFNPSIGASLHNLSVWAETQETMDGILEIHTNFNGDVNIVWPK